MKMDLEKKVQAINEIDPKTGKEMDLQELENRSEVIGMYSFFDKKSQRYDTPFFCQNDMFAGRHYKMVVDREGTMINKFKRDFDVHRLGFLDVTSGYYYIKFEIIIEGSKVYPEKEE